MTMEINKQHFEINYDNLALEVRQQPSIYQFYAEMAAEAKESRDRLANGLDHMEATINLEIRANATAAGQKLTEAMVSAMIERDPQIAKAKDDLLQANKDLQIVETAVKAMEQKCKMLDLAVRLKLARSNYESDGCVDDEVQRGAVDEGLKASLNG